MPLPSPQGTSSGDVTYGASAKGEAACVAPECSRMPSPGTLFLSLPRGVDFQAPRTVCRRVYCWEKHGKIGDRRGVAVERQKGPGKRLGSPLSWSVRCCQCLPPSPPSMDAAATAQC